ncbi:conserved hypothetical protein [Vibrio chagasii]|nr:conserved hypothetical protein [Vibrio chagasii]
MEQNSSSGKDSGMAVAIMLIILMFAIPFVFKQYIYPPYAYVWFHTRFFFFEGLSELLKLPFMDVVGKYAFFYVDYFYIGGRVDSASISFYIDNATSFLNGVDRRSIASVVRSITDREGETLREFVIISRLQSAILCPIYLAILFRVYKKVQSRKEYDTVFTLDTFAETMSGGFKELLPVVFDNPQRWGSLDDGPWRMSPKIKSYLENVGCLTFDDTPNGKEFSINLPSLRKLLVSQLGEKWRGFDKLTQSKRFLAAAAIPMVVSPAKGKERTENLVEMLAEAHSSEPGVEVVKSALLVVINPLKLFKPTLYLSSLIKVLFPLKYIAVSKRKRSYMKLSIAESNRIIDELGGNIKVTSCIREHAYEYCIIARLIEQAWEGGVLPSCSMIWLKKSDRELFYMFNNLGREVAWVEVAGFWGHYLTERKSKLAYPYPVLENTVYGLDKYLLESFYGYNPIHEELLDIVV